MVNNNIYQPVFKAAHQHSMNNRPILETGGTCGCFHCLKTFDASSQVTRWGGKENTTALCPFCHYDTVLSEKSAPIDPTFLQQMFASFFGGATTKLNLTPDSQQNPQAAE